jgi:hypothetical protein
MAIFHGKHYSQNYFLNFLMFVYILKIYLIKNVFHSKKKLKFLQRKMFFLFSILDNTFWIFNKKLIISLNIFFVKNMKLKNNNFINYFIKIKIEGEVLI